MSFDDYPAPELPEKYLVCPECEHEGPHHGSDHDTRDPKLVLTCRACGREWAPHELWFDDFERQEEHRASEPRRKHR